MNIDQQIEREIRCIKDLTTEIVMLAQKGKTDKAHLRKQDLHNSLTQLEKLHRQKELWSTVATLNSNGILQRAVDELAY